MVKKIIILLFGIYFSSYSFSQTNDTIKSFIDYCFLPEYKGGMENLIQFIAKNVHYPETAIKDSIEGTVYIGFIIKKNGETGNHKILKGVREDMNNEALRVSKLIIFDKPGRNCKGEPEEQEFMIPIKFYIKNGVKKK